MKSLTRYAVANAVARTMLSELLTSEDFEHIIRTGSLEEAWLALGRTVYGDYVPEDIKADELAVEKALREVTAQRFRRVTRHLAGRPAEVGKILLSRWELDNLEFALRLWHGKDTSLDQYITYPSFVYDIPLYQITASESIDEVALALRHTPYFEPLASSAKTYKTRRSIFYVEVALENDYYARLMKAIVALGGKDRSDAERLIASEIDVLNLSWLARLVQYYDVREAEVREFMIPGPSPISRRLAAPGETGEAISDITSELLAGRPAEGRAGAAGRRGKGGVPGPEVRATISLERLSLLEHMVSEMGVDAAHGLLAGYPFRMTGTIAFYILSRVELRNLVTVFVGKARGMTDSDISERLYGLR